MNQIEIDPRPGRKFKYTMSINNAYAIYLLLHGNSAVWATLSAAQRRFAKENNHLFEVGVSNFWKWRVDQKIKFLEEYRGFKYDENGPKEGDAELRSGRILV